MKFRTCLAMLVTAALIGAGCGSDGDSEKKDTPSTKQSASDKVLASKQDAVKKAEADFKKDNDNVDTCRNLAMSYVSLASPESTGDPKKAPKQPKDREKNLAKSTDTLEKCAQIAPRDRNVQQMLASTMMATGKYDEASPILEKLAKSAPAAEAANAFYAWGLAASNAQDLKSAIAAWQRFVALAPKGDQRVPQVRTSIKALQTAAARPAAPAATTATAEDEGGDDKGSDADAGDDKGNEDSNEDDKG